jgi:hypothetical protein
MEGSSNMQDEIDRKVNRLRISSNFSFPGFPEDDEVK